MNPGRIYAIILRVFYLMRGSFFTRIFPLFGWAAIDILLWGFITRYLDTVVSTAHFIPTMLGAVLMWDFCTRAMFGVSTAFFEDVWSRNFLNLFSTPITVIEYLLGLVVTSVGTSGFGLVAMLLLATLAFDLSLLTYGFWFIPFILELFLFGIALGIFAIALVLRFGPSAEWFIWPMPAILSPFAAVFYPLASLPVWMQYIARLLPASYVFEGMRALLASHAVPAGTLSVGAGLSALYIALACWFFQTMYRRAVRTGLIARYSAESVT